MNCNNIITIRRLINDLFERLLILLYTYIFYRRREDYYLMYYLKILLDKL